MNTSDPSVSTFMIIELLYIYVFILIMEKVSLPFLLRVEVGVESVELVGDLLASTAAGFSGRGGLVWNTQHTLSRTQVCVM